MYVDNTIRQCSRCGQELTDPASREAGVGPICRKKDNHLYAKSIAANFAGSTMCIMSVKMENLQPETRTRFEAMKMALLKRAEKATRRNDDPTLLHLTGEDVRKIIRELDWLLSYRTDNLTKTLLVNCVRHLGYVGLAGVLSGKAATSEAEIWFDAASGRVGLKGLGCTDGYRAMSRIQGIVKPRYRGDRNPYSAPAVHCEAFLNVVSEFWPCYKGDVSEVLGQATAWIAAQPVPVVVAPIAAVKPTVNVLGLPVSNVTVRPLEFTVTFPWVQGTLNVIAKIKGINYKHRTYNPGTKAWTIRSAYLDQVKVILGTIYTVNVVQG
jgi:hypothetical protein